MGLFGEGMGLRGDRMGLKGGYDGEKYNKENFHMIHDSQSSFRRPNNLNYIPVVVANLEGKILVTTVQMSTVNKSLIKFCLQLRYLCQSLPKITIDVGTSS